MRQVVCTLSSGFLFLGCLLLALFCDVLAGPRLGEILRLAALLLTVFSAIPLLSGTLLWYKAYIYNTPWTDENKK